MSDVWPVTAVSEYEREANKSTVQYEQILKKNEIRILHPSKSLFYAHLSYQTVKPTVNKLVEVIVCKFSTVFISCSGQWFVLVG